MNKQNLKDGRQRLIDNMGLYVQSTYDTEVWLLYHEDLYSKAVNELNTKWTDQETLGLPFHCPWVKVNDLKSWDPLTQNLSKVIEKVIEKSITQLL